MNVTNNIYNDVNAIVNGYWQNEPAPNGCLTISGNTINPGKWGTSSIVLWDWAQYQAWLKGSTDSVTSAIKAVVENNTVSNGELEYHKIHCDWFTPSDITLPEGAKVINHNLVQIDGEDISDVAVYDADGELVANMSSSDDKNYIYQLPEGKYTFRITQSQTGGDSIVTEQTVTVKKPDGLEKTQKFEVKPLTETAVAKVGETTYTSLANAIEAAKNGGTVEILADASIDTWNQVWNINNLTIKGNNHSITIGQVKSNINGDYLFYGAENLNVSDLTINFKTNGNGFSMVSGKLENVKMYGGSNSNSDYAVFVGTSEDPDAKVEISNCTFDNFGIAVYSQPAGADKHTSDISVNKTTFTNCGMTMCSYAQNTVFTDNIVNGGSEISFAGGAEGNDRQNSYTITGNTFQNAGKIWFSDVDLGDVTFTKNKVLGTTEVSTEQAKDETVLNVSENYWGGQAPGEGQLTSDWEDSFEGQDVYYVRDTMRPQDLNTYVPSGGGGGTVETKYDISVDSAANGTVKASASTSAKDKTVTLTVTPDEGYVLDTLTVTDKDGKNVELTKKSDTEYTFQMPSSKVTVKAVFKEETAESTLPFTDVSDADWFYPAVKYVYDNDMMDGVGGSLFAPASQLTRGMIAQVLYNLEKATGDFNGSFTDVAADEWYADAVNWAAECGIVNGFGDGTFGPEQNITREQMAQILMNYAKYKGYDMTAKGDVSVFTDAAEISGWAQDAVSWAVGEKLLSGKGNGILDPAGTATRAEVAQIFMNFCENIAK